MGRQIRATINEQLALLRKLEYTLNIHAGFYSPSTKVEELIITYRHSEALALVKQEVYFLRPSVFSHKTHLKIARLIGLRKIALPTDILVEHIKQKLKPDTDLSSVFKE
jgi:hypothetical protein